MTHPLIGKPAPSVTIPDHNGEMVTLNEGGAGSGVPVALFFYPKSGELYLLAWCTMWAPTYALVFLPVT